MSSTVRIAPAGNVLPSALACIRELGYKVSFHAESQGLEAKSETATFIAEDPLLLLGLIKLYEIRGENWRPTDGEVEEFLKLDNAQLNQTECG